MVAPATAHTRVWSLVRSSVSLLFPLVVAGSGIIGAAKTVAASVVPPPMEAIVYRFRRPPDTSESLAGLIADKKRGLYGTASNGGTKQAGAVFKLTAVRNGYTESVLYSFNSGSDGANPYAGLLAESTGGLYGTTAAGGRANDGTVFELTPSGPNYAERVIHEFSGTDGANPYAGLIADETGALYGTTESGGTCASSASGCGTVFKLTPSGSSYVESVLHAFSGSDGANPYAGLIADKAGALFGTAFAGGAFNNGIVFKLTPMGSGYEESVLYSFPLQVPEQSGRLRSIRRRGR